MHILANNSQLNNKQAEVINIVKIYVVSLDRYIKRKDSLEINNTIIVNFKENKSNFNYITFWLFDKFKNTNEMDCLNEISKKIYNKNITTFFILTIIENLEKHKSNSSAFIKKLKEICCYLDNY